MEIKELIEKIEIVSKDYIKKFGINNNKDFLILKLQEELWELTQSYLLMTNRHRNKNELTSSEIKKDFESEVADVFWHLLLLIKHFDIDIEKTVDEKWFKYLK